MLTSLSPLSVGRSLKAEVAPRISDHVLRHDDAVELISGDAERERRLA
jgi:hypothetical protein